MLWTNTRAERSDPPATTRSKTAAESARERATAARLAAEAAESEAEVAEARDRASAARLAAARAEEVVQKEPAKVAGRQRSTRAIAAVVLAWLAGFALLGLSGHFVKHHHDVTTRQAENAAFVQAARQGVMNMTTLDFNNAEADVQRVIDGSTGGFRDDFQGRSESFISTVQASKVVTEGTVSDAGVESTDGDSAVVLVAATSEVTNTAGAQEEPRSWRLRVTVSPDGDQLKMSKVEFVP